MTLGQFAVAVGAEPRWVLNALTRLHVPRRYGEPLARRLALAKMLNDALEIPLPRAYALAGRSLAEADPFASWRLESDNGAVILTVDLPRFFTSYGTRLALSRNAYGEDVRGRHAVKRKSAGQRARAYGVDTTLIDAQLRYTPEERLRRVAEDMEFYGKMRGAAREAR
jgi:hypothetical protein